MPSRPTMSITVLDGVGPVLDVMAATVAARVEAAMQRGAEEIEDYAQGNAPWADRSGAARAGLHAEVRHEFDDIVIELSHSVDYGIWLELIQDGRFAIIMPTLEALGPRIIREAGGKVTEII